jgi:glycosyltransferase involved in cell wall biosynthesis
MPGSQSSIEGSPHPDVHLFHHSFSEGGGAERYSRDFADELVRRGRNVIFHARRVDEHIVRPAGLEVRPVRSGTFPRKLKDFYYHQKIAALAPTLSGTQFAMTRVPVRDGEICGGTHRGYFLNARKWMGLFDRLQVAMEMKSYHFCRKMISHSHLCAGELKDLYGLPEERVVTIHPPADLKKFSPVSAEQRREIRRRLELPEGRTVFAFPSSGHKRKGLHPLIDAMKPFGDQVILVVAGSPPGRVPDFVHYLGHLKSDEVADLYRAADYTAMASYYEPFGLIGVESVLCGTRVVFEQKMGCLEVIRPSASLRFDVWRAESIRQSVADAIAQFKAGVHRLENPADELTYDPSVETHVTRVMEVLEPAD